MEIDSVLKMGRYVEKNVSNLPFIKNCPPLILMFFVDHKYHLVGHRALNMLCML
jgi:hypothetical protein